MRITAFLLLIGCLHVSAKTKAQVITLSFKDAPLEKVFAEIKKQTGYSFIYNNNLVANTSKVDLQVANASVDEVLQQCLKDQPLTYSIVEKTVIIKPKDVILSRVEAQPAIDISGRITDPEDKPLEGANVKVKGSNNGTTTNADGIFVLRNVDETGTLEISYVGFETQFIAVNNRSSISLALKRSESPLDEVQVIAYGTTSRRLSTGDVTTVTSKEIDQQPISNPLLALEGSVPGLFITQNTGVPGGGFNVRIQGQNSILQGSDPFYVIDGVPFVARLLPNQSAGIFGGNSGNNGNPLNYINPSDIESISVLKDADATAIYGSRGANGAILITTKKGKSGGTRLNVNTYTGIGKAPLNINLLSTPEYLQMRNEAFKNDGVTPDSINAPDLLVWDTTKYTNWQKAMIGGTSRYNDAQVSFSGGNTNTQFLFGGGYHSESTVFPTTSIDKKGSLHVNITNTSVDQKFKLFFSGNYVSDISNLPSIDLTNLITLAPDAPNFYNADGSLNWSPSLPSGNPFATLKQMYQSKTTNLVGNADLSYNLLKGLNIKSSFGYTNMQVSEMSSIPISGQNPAYNPVGYSNFTNNNIHSWIIEPQISFKPEIKFGLIEALLGSTFEQNTSIGQILHGSGYTSDALLGSALAAPTITIASETNTIYKYNAFFGRLNYNYKDRYLINLNWRRDGSSRFGSNNQFHNFGSVGAAWIFSNEGLIKNNFSALSFGKLRASYGTTGNDQIGDYNFYDLFAPTSYSYQGTTGLNPVSLYNPELAWELTKKFEGSIELGFLNDRILLSSTYYLNRSSNQLLFYLLPGVTGFTGIEENFPATVQNNGLEFVLNTTNIKTRDFSWTSSLNFTLPHNELVSFPNLANTTYQNFLVIGQPLGIVKAFHTFGVNDTTGVYEFTGSKGTPTYSPVYGSDNNTIINTAPRLYGGFRNTINYKGVELEFLFQFTKQLGFNYLFQTGLPPGNIYAGNEPKAILNRWQNPGDLSSTQQYTQSFSSNAYSEYSYARQSNRAYIDASYIRLKNVSLSYLLPEKINTKMHIQNCSIYIHGQNLLTITKYKGLDPESQSLFVLPPLRVITGGIRFSF